MKIRLFLLFILSMLVIPAVIAWDNTSCNYRTPIMVLPQATDDNFALNLTLDTTGSNWNTHKGQIYAIENSTGKYLAWISYPYNNVSDFNKASTRIMANMSVTKNSAIGINIYYDCGGNTQHYKLADVFLFNVTSDWNRQSDIDKATMIQVNTHTLNLTNYFEGNASLQFGQSGGNPSYQLGIKTGGSINRTIECYFYDGHGNGGAGTDYFGINEYDNPSRAMGVYNTNLDTCTDYWLWDLNGGNRGCSSVPKVKGAWVKVVWKDNGTGVEMYANNQLVYTADSISTTYWGIQHGDNAPPDYAIDDCIFYSDYGNLNPVYTPGSEESSAAPVVSYVSISPAVAYTTNDLTCSFIVNGGGSLTANVTWINGTNYFKSYIVDAINNTPVNNVLKAANTSSGQTWNCSIIAYDGSTYSKSNSTARLISSSSVVFSQIANITKTLGFGSDTINLSAYVTDANPDYLKFNYTYINSNETILLVSISNATGFFTYSEATNYTGSVIIQITAYDEEGQSDNVLFSITIISLPPAYAPSTTAESLWQGILFVVWLVMLILAIWLISMGFRNGSIIIVLLGAMLGFIVVYKIPQGITTMFNNDAVIRGILAVFFLALLLLMLKKNKGSGA